MSGGYLTFLIVVLGIVPVLATNWRWLILLTALALIPAILAGLLPDDPWAIAAAFLLGIPVAIGAVARALSLVAERLGHRRPYSLWMEVLVFAAVISFFLVS